jgi:Domain of unknown function (DUF4253)
MSLKNPFASFFSKKSVPQTYLPTGYLYPEANIKCPIYELDGKDALGFVRRFSAENPGFVLVPLGDASDKASMLEVLEDREQTPDQVEVGDFEQFLKTQKEERAIEFGADSVFPRGEWDDNVDRVSPYYGSIFEWTKDGPVAHKKVLAVALPSTPEWSALKFVPFGGWNDCPFDEIHLAANKKWFERYGAKLEGMTRDILTFNVANPPSTREDAIKLAEEQFLYCPDIVEQGTETIDALASSLLNNKTWFFWWD